MTRGLISVLVVALAAPLLRAADDPAPTKGPYAFGPDSVVQPGVPSGAWDKIVWDKSEAYPGTMREVWVYAPAQYDPKVPACLMVFQDGPRQFALRAEDPPEARRGRHTPEYRTPTVLDNLIHRKELPVIVAVFVNPGSFQTLPNGNPDFANRSVEYDTVSDAYSQFLFNVSST